jgi:predicted regulator of Ras-like GTPase activity (Roadblock/LC7/MglB family)
MSDQPVGRAARLDHALADLLSQAPELEAAAVVSYDGLAMASALPLGMDEDRVAAMSAALLSLGEKAAQGLGRGDLSQVYVEGETGTVFLVSCDDEAVLVAVAAAGAKAGLMLFEVRRASAAIAEVLRVAAPPAPSIVDHSALADAEAAYQAHKDAIAEAERAIAAQQAVQAALVPVPTPVLVPVDDEPLQAPTPIGTVYHPDTPLEPTPSLTLASWMTTPQAESSRS